MKLAIIGAGIAGLTCAHEAKSAGHDVTVFDKGRGAGGRCSTRRLSSPQGELRADHGAMGFQVRSPDFSGMVQNWMREGWLSEWKPRLASLENGMMTSMPTRTWYTGTPGMNGLVKGLCQGLDVQFGIRISHFHPEQGQWRISFEDDPPDAIFDGVVSAAPAEQTAILLETAAPELAESARQAVSLPCWALMLSFETPLKLEYDLILGSGEDTPFHRIIRNSSKPMRDQTETWVIHASPNWTREHLDWTKEDVAEALTSLFQASVGTTDTPTVSSAHRWLYAQNETPVGTPANWDEAIRIGTCGDWHIGSDIESAWLSGRVLGERLKTL